MDSVTEIKAQPTPVELPQFRSHKLVRAAKIEAIRIGFDAVGSGRLSLRTTHGDLIQVYVLQAYMQKHLPEVGGYYVQYQDGYESFSPADAFEGGYREVVPARTTAAMVREITSHQVNTLNVGLCIKADAPGSGNASHFYTIESQELREASQPPSVMLPVRFQDGPIGEVGVNGISNEALLAIVEDRLKGFQGGPYACRENAIALTKIQEAMHWLHHRTREREARGVEGTHSV